MKSPKETSGGLKLKLIVFKVTNGGGAKTPPEETAADPELAKYLNRDYWQSKQVQNILQPIKLIRI